MIDLGKLIEGVIKEEFKDENMSKIKDIYSHPKTHSVISRVWNEAENDPDYQKSKEKSLQKPFPPIMPFEFSVKFALQLYTMDKLEEYRKSGSGIRKIKSIIFPNKKTYKP